MISNLLLQLVVLFLPTQLGLHFWPDFSRVVGIKIDFLSPTLYLTDILIFLYLISNFHQLSSFFRSHLQSLLFVLCFVILNIFFAISPLNSFFWWLRVFVYLLLFICLRLQKVSWVKIQTSLLISSLLIVVVQVSQYIKISSLNGLFYYLGEREYTFSSPNLARFNIFGHDILRSPSFFSHPNSLAGYLLLILYLLFTYQSSWRLKLLFFTSLCLTFSKGALLGFLLVLVLHISPFFIVTIFSALSFLQLLLPHTVSTFSFVSDRLFLTHYSGQLINKFFFLGTGLGNFIPALSSILPGSFLYPAKLQPIHNIFLLFFIEVGVFGIISLTFVVQKVRHLLDNPIVLNLISLVIITGTFDHYWLTLPQNKLILLLSLALVL